MCGCVRERWCVPLPLESWESIHIHITVASAQGNRCKVSTVDVFPPQIMWMCAHKFTTMGSSPFHCYQGNGTSCLLFGFYILFPLVAPLTRVATNNDAHNAFFIVFLDRTRIPISISSFSLAFMADACSAGRKLTSPSSSPSSRSASINALYDEI